MSQPTEIQRHSENAPLFFDLEGLRQWMIDEKVFSFEPSETQIKRWIETGKIPYIDGFSSNYQFYWKHVLDAIIGRETPALMSPIFDLGRSKKGKQ